MKSRIKHGILACVLACVFSLFTPLWVGCNKGDDEGGEYLPGDDYRPSEVDETVVYAGTSLSNAITLEDNTTHKVDIRQGAKTYYKTSSMYYKLAISFDGKSQDATAMLSAVKFYRYLNNINDSLETSRSDAGGYLCTPDILNASTGQRMNVYFYVVIEWYYMANNTNNHIVKVV